MRRIIAFAICIGLSTVSVSASQSDTERRTIGTLTCINLVARPVTKPTLGQISCTFEPFDSNAKSTYTGELIHRGPNVILGAREVLVWNVWAHRDSGDATRLTGKYFGLRKDDPSLPGIGMNTLVGGNGNGILLEPVVNPGVGKGPHKTLTVVELELRPARI